MLDILFEAIILYSKAVQTSQEVIDFIVGLQKRLESQKKKDVMLITVLESIVLNAQLMQTAQEVADLVVKLQND